MCRRFDNPRIRKVELSKNRKGRAAVTALITRHIKLFLKRVSKCKRRTNLHQVDFYLLASLSLLAFTSSPSKKKIKLMSVLLNMVKM